MTASAKTLAMQAKMKTADLNDEAYRNLVKSNKVWSDLPTANHVTPYAEGLIHAAMDRDSLYDPRRVGERDFDVTCSAVIEPFNLRCGWCPPPRRWLSGGSIWDGERSDSGA